MTFPDQLILYGSILSPVLPLVVGVAKRRELSQPFVILITLVAIAFAAELIMVLLAVGGQNNLVVSHVFGLVEGALLISFFHEVLRMPKRRYRYLLTAFILLYISISILFDNILEFNTYSRSFEALLMVVFAILSLHLFYVKEEDIFIEKSPEFWIVIAVLIYFSGGLFSFLLSSDMLSQSPDHFYGSWIIHNFSNLVRNILFTIGLWRIKN
jgi:hypothetical protein